jgi:acetyl-CoA carboxylase biotin carboxyl carrier protein
MSLRFEEIAEILKIIDSSSCEELVVETGDVKLVVRRSNGHGSAHGNGAAPAPCLSAASPPPAAAAGIAPATAAPAASISVPARGPQRVAGQIEITAPMVGTFYRASAPEAAPFVEIGSEVSKGQPVCLIEVMKLFTTIYSEHDGRVVAIGAENGELVEYGRALFVLESV